MIEKTGLLSTFFAAVKNNSHVFLTQKKRKASSNKPKIANSALYIITFNSPNQMKASIHSMLAYGPDFAELLI